DVAVGNQLFAWAQGGLLARPEDLIAHPVGEIKEFRLAELNHPGMAKIKASVVTGNYRIVLNDVVEFLAALDSPGHDGIGIHGALRAGEDLQCRVRFRFRVPYTGR